MDPAQLDRHFPDMLDALADGGVVPLLGAGANLSGRPSGWVEGSKYLPEAATSSRSISLRGTGSTKTTRSLSVSPSSSLSRGPVRWACIACCTRSFVESTSRAPSTSSSRQSLARFVRGARSRDISSSSRRTTTVRWNPPSMPPTSATTSFGTSPRAQTRASSSIGRQKGGRLRRSSKPTTQMSRRRTTRSSSRSTAAWARLRGRTAT